MAQEVIQTQKRVVQTNNVTQPETIVTTESVAQPAAVVETTTTQVEETPVINRDSDVYDEKRAVFKFSQVVWFILGIVESLLALRFILKLLGANPVAGFTSFIYALTDIFVLPFQGIFQTPTTGGSVFDIAAVVAGIVYFLLALAIVYLIDLFNPITREEAKRL